jgi:enterochelin esterase-like enzyme
MLCRTFSTSIFLVLFFLSALAGTTELQVGKAQEGALHDGRGDTYTVKLTAGDYLQATVDLRDTALIITVYDPSGSKFRAFRLDPDYGTQVRFVAESTGTYRLETAGSERTKTGNYSITLDKVVSLDERLALAPAPELYESGWIKKLKADLKAGKPDALPRFWEEVAAKTTPLLEPLAGDNKYMLVTFLWKGNDATRNVEVQWFPYARAWPDDYRMVHLASANVWYKTFKVNRQGRFVYRLAPNESYLRSTRNREEARLSMFFTSGQTDPLNPKHWLHFPDNPEAARFQDWSAVEMPDAPPQPWVELRAGVPAGIIEAHQFTSALLKNERELSIYLPPGYNNKDAQHPYDLIVLFDGGAYVTTKRGPPLIPAPTTLDNLIAARRIPPVVALFIDSPPGMRNIELDCNRKFLESLNAEMIPWVREHYNVTKDPKNTVVGGLSLGGLAATCAALYYPETFGNVLSQSGGYSRTPTNSDNPLEFNPDAEPNWMATQFIASPRLQVRFYLTAGADEFDPSGRGQDILTSSRHLRDVLLAKGYEVHFQEYFGGHDFLSWRGSLADGLIALIGTDQSHNH